MSFSLPWKSGPVNSKWEPARRLFYIGLLRCASLLVPRNRRAEWSREWRGELWHVRQACTPAGRSGWKGEREVTQFCLGAFQDALCLRRAGQHYRQTFAAIEGTARQCILILVAILALSDAIALLLPGVRAELSLWPRKVNPSLVLIQNQGSNFNSPPSISPTQFRSWKARQQKYFDNFAFYRVTHESVELEPGSGQKQDSAGWGVAHASSNLFMLLGFPVQFARPARASDGDLPEVILGESVWKRQFGADPRVSGGVISLGAQKVRIAGVVPDGSLGLPGRVDAWLLEPDAAIASGRAGYVIAHLTEMGKAEMWAPNIQITAIAPGGAEDDLLGVALEEWKPDPGTVYGFALFLALLSLPAITSVSLGDASVNPQKTPWATRLYGWSFLSAKIALLLPIVHFASLDLAYGFTAIGREQAVYLQLASTFLMSLFGLRWVLKDQRQRCPVCMRRVAHPARVGQASRTFLDWNGTEMMCMGGHTLLHVPSLPTSWFSNQRWLYLDTSWGFLFAEPTRPIP